MTTPIIQPIGNPLSILDARSKDLSSVHYGCKLAEGRYASQIITPLTEMDYDLKRMSVWIPFADGNRRDGVGDVTDVMGLQTERHQLNPVVIFDHGKKCELPIGLSIDPETKSYTVEIDPVNKTARGQSFFYQGTGLPEIDRKDEHQHAIYCHQIFDLIVKGLIRGGSFGYQIIRAYPLQPNYETGTPQGLHLEKTLLLEYGPTVIPANMDTVRGKSNDAVREILAMPKVCGYPLSPILYKSLEAMAPMQTKTVSGYERKMNRQTAERQGLEPIFSPGHQYAERIFYDPREGKYYDASTDLYLTLEEVHTFGIPKAMSSLNETSGGALRGLGKKSNLGLGEPEDMKETNVPPPTWKPGLGATKAQPSDKISPEKARQILKDGEANGHPLTEKQRGMFGAAAGRKKMETMCCDSSGSNYRGPRTKPKPKTNTKQKALRMKYRKKAQSTDDAASENVGEAYQDVRDGKALERAYKSLHQTRRKYRNIKRLRLRRKHSSPGTSYLYVHGKDLPAVKSECDKKGLKFHHVGTHSSGAARVKLIGDDDAIDGVAQQWGKRMKSLSGSKAYSRGCSPMKSLKKGLGYDVTLTVSDPASVCQKAELSGITATVVGKTDVVLSGVAEVELGRFFRQHAILPDSEIEKLFGGRIGGRQKALGKKGVNPGNHPGASGAGVEGPRGPLPTRPSPQPKKAMSPGSHPGASGAGAEGSRGPIPSPPQPKKPPSSSPSPLSSSQVNYATGGKSAYAKFMKSLRLRYRAKSTCGQGERSDLTGCTPAGPGEEVTNGIVTRSPGKMPTRKAPKRPSKVETEEVGRDFATGGGGYYDD